MGVRVDLRRFFICKNLWYPLFLLLYLFRQIYYLLQHFLLAFRTRNRQRKDYQFHQIIILKRHTRMDFSIDHIKSRLSVNM